MKIILPICFTVIIYSCVGIKLNKLVKATDFNDSIKRKEFGKKAVSIIYNHEDTNNIFVSHEKKIEYLERYNEYCKKYPDVCLKEKKVIKKPDYVFHISNRNWLHGKWAIVYVDCVGLKSYVIYGSSFRKKDSFTTCHCRF